MQVSNGTYFETKGKLCNGNLDQYPNNQNICLRTENEMITNTISWILIFSLHPHIMKQHIYLFRFCHMLPVPLASLLFVYINDKSRVKGLLALTA